MAQSAGGESNASEGERRREGRGEEGRERETERMMEWQRGYGGGRGWKAREKVRVRWETGREEATQEGGENGEEERQGGKGATREAGDRGVRHGNGGKEQGWWVLGSHAGLGLGHRLTLCRADTV